MKVSYKALVATTAAATIIGVASVGVTRPNRTTVTSSVTTTSTTTAAARPGRPSPGPIPTSALMASPARLVITANAGSQSARTLSVTYSGSGGFLHVGQDSGALAPNPTVTPLGNGQFTVTLRTSDVIPEGAYRGTVRLRLCAETPCATVLATASVPYRMTLKWANVGEWETFQRDAGHTGHVPIVVDPARIAKKWEWQTTKEGVVSINTVATEVGKVFVSDDVYFAPASLYALSETDGSEIWRHDFGTVPILNPPAAANGRVYIATTGHDQTFLWSFNSSDGSQVSQSPFYSQWPHVLAPTVKNGKVYTSSGDGGMYVFDATDGAYLWSRFSGQYEGTTVALDDSRAYFYDGSGLQVYETDNGDTRASIADPLHPDTAYWYSAAPMLGSSGNVIAFSGGVTESRALVNYFAAGFTTRWSTPKIYTTHPAVADGVVYAGSKNSFDAIDEATGHILWSWVPGIWGMTFNANVVVTKNLAFVSTNQGLYAISLATHQPVWSWPAQGSFAISGSGTLYLVESTSPSKLVAFKLH